MKLKKAISILVVAVIMFTLNASAFATEVYKFTVQPKGGEAANNQPFTFTWETNANCKYMLQARDNETYDWGNMDWITSPHSLDWTDYTSQFRIMAVVIDNDTEFYSDVFTITWKPADDSTEVSMSAVEFAEVLLGYDKVETLPITVTNVGAYTLRTPDVFMGDGSDKYFEIIQNRKPHDLLPGESDNSTWSIRPKKGLGIGDYHELFYLSAENIAEYASASCDLSVKESEVKLTYSMEAKDIDFGTFEEGYGDVDDITLTVRATGTGNLTKIHIKTENAEKQFFMLRQNSAEIDKLAAGTDTGKNWYVYLNSGLEPGDYTAHIQVYAAEIAEPLNVKISAKITAKPVSEPSEVSETSEELSEESSEESSEEAGNSTSEGISESGSSSSSDDGKSSPIAKLGNMWLIIAIAGAVVIIIVIIIVLVVLKKSRNKDNNNNNNNNNDINGGSGFGVTFDGNAGCSGGNTVDNDGTAYGAGGFDNNAGAGYDYGNMADGAGTGYSDGNNQNNFYNGY